MTVPDFSTLPDDELATTVAAAQAELDRRQTIADAQRRTDDMCLGYLHAIGRKLGGPWEAPTGFVGAYPTGWRVTHDGYTYEATAPGVTSAPPSDDWVEVDPDSPVIGYWEPRPYAAGEQVRDAGLVWTARTDVDGQRPSEYPGGWTPAT